MRVSTAQAGKETRDEQKWKKASVASRTPLWVLFVVLGCCAMYKWVDPD
jgi:hypothetical protein